MKSGLMISVIIPAANEEAFLPRTLLSLRSQTFPRDQFEIVVSVNGSTDGTFECAKKGADNVVYSEAALTPALARNRGAEVARGNIFVFLDADTTITSNMLERIQKMCVPETMGSVWCAPDHSRIAARLFMGMKNLVNFSRLYTGIGGGVFFCDAKLFRDAGGFNGTKRVSEFQEIIARLKQHGGSYVFIRDAVATTSVRRFEKAGYIKTIWFWIRWWCAWRLATFFGKENEVAREYHN